MPKTPGTEPSATDNGSVREQAKQIEQVPCFLTHRKAKLGSIQHHPLKTMAATLEKRYTYQDYKNLDVDDNYWYELLNGELVKKSAPSPGHQRLSGKLYLQLASFVNGNNLGEVFYAPIDVFLDEENAPQPDLVFVSTAKKSLITNDGIMGAPDLVVEIISPNSVKRDRVDKMKLYKKYQVRECWLIDPNNRSVEVYVFQEQEKDYDIFSFAVTDGTVQSQVLAGFSVEIAPLFV